MFFHLDPGVKLGFVTWGGGGVYDIKLIYTFTFSNFADTFIQNNLQMRTMEIYTVCIVCACVCARFIYVFKYDLF